MAINLTNNPSDGTVFGSSPSDKIGFYGLSPPIVRPTISSGVPVSSATAIATIQVVISTLGNLGIITAT